MATKSSGQEMAGFTYIWRIENFLLERDIRSPKFIVKMLRNSQWYLALKSICEEETHVFLYKCGGKDFINICFTISLLNIDGSNIFLFKQENQMYGKEKSWGCKLDQEPLLQKAYEQNGTLTLVLHIWNELTTKNKPVKCSITTRLPYERHVFNLPIERFSRLRPGDERNFSVSCINFGQPQLDMNIHLKVDKEGCFNCKVQKIKPKSPFEVVCRIMATAKGLKIQLTKMCVNFLKEKSKPHRPESLKINIYTADKNFDLPGDVLVLFCEFFVHGITVHPTLHKAPALTQEVKVVLSSDTQTDSTEKCMFSKMDDLIHFFKESKLFCHVTVRTGKCICFLTSELTVENVCEAFLLSDIHHDESLRRSAQKFFSENFKSILCSKEWNEFRKKRRELASDVLQSFAEEL